MWKIPKFSDSHRRPWHGYALDKLSLTLLLSGQVGISLASAQKVQGFFFVVTAIVGAIWMPRASNSIVPFRAILDYWVALDQTTVARELRQQVSIERASGFPWCFHQEIGNKHVCLNWEQIWYRIQVLNKVGWWAWGWVCNFPCKYHSCRIKSSVKSNCGSISQRSFTSPFGNWAWKIHHFHTSIL